MLDGRYLQCIYKIYTRYLQYIYRISTVYLQVWWLLTQLPGGSNWLKLRHAINLYKVTSSSAN